ncbi:hypothetical protein CA11_02060 [Gimesia maris]|uniref:hypothetical protein n=1 Tax=Gimesia maris TaxID=122 RepID=UPI0011885CE1|nr:hypothetical protein [Gimesia maris]QDU12429.1 hypothetical protein CA11_02060 [Gimesia maris]
MPGDTFPTVSSLWQGALLGSIVNAVMTAFEPEYASIQGWSNNTYLVDNWNGHFAMIGFGKKCRVAAFFMDPKSPLSPFIQNSTSHMNVVLNQMPRCCRLFANQGPLKFYHQELNDKYQACFTTAFWAETDDDVDSHDTWSVIYENGAHIIRIQLLDDISSAMMEWEDSYQMEQWQSDLALSLFNRRILEPESEWNLLPNELSLLMKSHNKRAFDLSLTKFSEILFNIPG